ncbi:MAG: aminoacyl-tRNA hydrolase [Phycisphaerae bacterium]
MKLIVGLGNPGPQYVGTRHNVGFEVVDILASRWGVSMAAEKFHGFCGLHSGFGERLILLKPLTFMNRSGRAVAAAGRFYKLELDDLLVISDDMALPVGALRMRTRGSAGSHNGLQNIVDRLGTDVWCRLRVGIGEPIGNPTNYVLGRFAQEEEAIMDTASERAADAVECWIKDGPDLAMTRFNGPPPADPKDD